MALDAATLWEIRSAGNANNGAGFADLDPGTSVDYSNQDAAQLSLTDLATSGIGVTTVTSVTGGFTAAMVGNNIYFASGTNVTPGYRQIDGFTDGNTISVETAPDDGVGGIASGVGSLGGAGILENKLFAAGVDGNTRHVRADGTHTLTADITIYAGTAALPILTHGYNTTRGDKPTGANRPDLALGAFFLAFGNYNQAEHLDWSGTDNYCVFFDAFCLVRNCKGVNTSTSVDRYPFNLGDQGIVCIDCDGMSPIGWAFYCNSSVGLLRGCHAHHSARGYVINNITTIEDCMIDTCTTYGVQIISGRTRQRIGNSDFYNSGIGVVFQGSDLLQVVINSQFTDCTTGMSQATAALPNPINYINMHGNGTDRVNVTAGDNDSTDDPAFVGENVWTNLACADHAGPPYDLTSADNNFDTYFEVDNLIHIETTGDSAHFVTGWYRIQSVAAGTLGLTTDPTDGTNETGGQARACNDFTPTLFSAGFPGTYPGALMSTEGEVQVGAVQRAAGGGAAGFALTPNAGVQR